MACDHCNDGVICIAPGGNPDKAYDAPCPDCGVAPEDDPRTAAEVHGETELELMRELGDM